MHYEVPTHILETMVSPTGDDKTLQPQHQKSMAVELLKRRKIMTALERKLGEVIIDKADLTALKGMLARELNNE
jgi:hypothetical protein